MSIGSLIRQARQAEKWSQGDLAMIAGVDTSQISRIEAGAVDARMSTVEKVLNVFELELADVFAGYNFGEGGER